MISAESLRITNKTNRFTNSYKLTLVNIEKQVYTKKNVSLFILLTKPSSQVVLKVTGHFFSKKL